MVIDPRTLKRAIPPRMIDEPRPCRYCGYNLQGLMNNGNCPECGRSITPRVDPKFGEDTLLDAPLGFIRTLAVGANLMFMGWLGLAVAILGLAFEPSTTRAGIYAASAIAWWVGVVVMARPRPPTEHTTKNRSGEWLGMRLACRITQAFWVLSGGMVVAAVSGSAPGWLGGAALVGGIIASGGLIAVCLFAANLQDWAANMTMALTLRRLAVLIALVPASLALISGGLLPAAMRILGGPQSPVVLMLIVVAVVAALPPLLFTWSLWDFRQTATWAVKNYHDVRAREERFLQRSYDQAAKGALADVGVDPADHPAIKLGSSDVPPPTTQRLTAANRARGMVKKKPGESNPYELAEEEP